MSALYDGVMLDVAMDSEYNIGASACPVGMSVQALAARTAAALERHPSEDNMPLCTAVHHCYPFSHWVHPTGRWET